jgi:hypothetical protein
MPIVYQIKLTNKGMHIDVENPIEIDETTHKKWSDASMESAKRFCDAFAKAVAEYEEIKEQKKNEPT